ncbi:hypothetical protein PCASD_07318 [Puccinia coronata f. sp. avenae]|uniref:ER membrane protein complex subunit 10 n=1 Tax=Puccinia coronata f. sp. avenae TaxID=200324 RepID=A0A2N5URI1_9BASI|nr:hypothetical protein PCASD_07318 [Puccinia coronata f. sp. avenae]
MEPAKKAGSLFLCLAVVTRGREAGWVTHGRSRSKAERALLRQVPRTLCPGPRGAPGTRSSAHPGGPQPPEGCNHTHSRLQQNSRYAREMVTRSMHTRLSNRQRPSRCGSLLMTVCLLATILETWGASPRSSYGVFHRLGPSGVTTSAGWQKRGVLEISWAAGAATPDHPDQRLQFNVSSFVKTSDPLQIPDAVAAADLAAWQYQVSLVPQDSTGLPGEAGRPDTGFAMSAIPLCAFEGDGTSGAVAVSEYLNIWVRPAGWSDRGEGAGEQQQQQQQSMHNLQLDLLGIQWSSSLAASPSIVACDTPVLASSTPDGSDGNDNDNDGAGRRLQDRLQATAVRLASHHAQSNIKVSVRRPERLPEPILTPHMVQKAPEFLPDGTVKPPVQEKGWLAKYWMYILPLVLMLVLGGGPPPPEESAAAEGGGGVGGGGGDQ